MIPEMIDVDEDSSTLRHQLIQLTQASNGSSVRTSTAKEQMHLLSRLTTGSEEWWNGYDGLLTMFKTVPI
jgi:hypothetical protein